MMTICLSSDCRASSLCLSLTGTWPCPVPSPGGVGSDIPPSWQLLALFGKALWVQHTTTIHRECPFCFCEKPWKTLQKRRLWLTYAGHIQRLSLEACKQTRIHIKSYLHCHLLSKTGIAVFPILILLMLNSTKIWSMYLLDSLGKMKQWRKTFFF